MSRNQIVERFIWFVLNTGAALFMSLITIYLVFSTMLGATNMGIPIFWMAAFPFLISSFLLLLLGLQAILIWTWRVRKSKGDVALALFVSFHLLLAPFLLNLLFGAWNPNFYVPLILSGIMLFLSLGICFAYLSYIRMWRDRK